MINDDLDRNILISSIAGIDCFWEVENNETMQNITELSQRVCQLSTKVCKVPNWLTVWFFSISIDNNDGMDDITFK